jgi:hypothetical protein
MRRGFKTWCEASALQHRKALGLGPTAPLRPAALAAHLGIVLLKPEEIPGLDKADLDRLLRKDSDSWSAVSIRTDTLDVVIVNSAHSPGRQTNSLAHELAHLILKHEPKQVIEHDLGLFLIDAYDRDQEDEADWLAGVLLLPRPALLEIAANGIDPATACNYFGVSEQLLTWRRRKTGVDTQVSRWPSRIRRAR